MNKHLIITWALTVFMNSCAVIDRHMFDPAASHARVAPLFRTDECKKYKAPNGQHWLTTLGEGSTKNMSSIFVSDLCEAETKSINDTPTWSDGTESIDGDRLYFTQCESTATLNKDQALSCFNYLVGRSNELCEIHKSHIYGNRTVMNTFFQVLAAGTGIAGSMSGVGAAQALAGSSSFLVSGQAIMNEEIYHNVISEALLMEIKANRSAFLTEKSTQMSAANFKPNLGQVRKDAIDYNNTCSFYDALTSLLKKAGKESFSENKALLSLSKQKKQIEDELTSETDSKKQTRLKTKLETIDSAISNLVSYASENK